MTHGAKNGGSFSEMIGSSTVGIWVVHVSFTYTIGLVKQIFLHKIAIIVKHVFWVLKRTFSSRQFF